MCNMDCPYLDDMDIDEENTSAQNHTLQQLGKKIDHVANQISQTETTQLLP